MAHPAPLPTASAADTARLVVQVLLPTVAKGPIIRRPTMVGLAERLELDDRAVRVVERLHDRYAPVAGRHASEHPTFTFARRAGRAPRAGPRPPG